MFASQPLQGLLMIRVSSAHRASALPVLVLACGILSGCSDSTSNNSNPGNGAAVRWDTFWGGSEEDQVRDLATDAQGNVYAVGGTSSNDFTTTPGAFDRTHDDSPNGSVKHYDVFVTKFDPSANF